MVAFLSGFLPLNPFIHAFPRSLPPAMAALFPTCLAGGSLGL
jgi:hypothetical protein